MKNTIKSINIWAVIVLWGGFWIIAPYVERHVLFDVMNAVSIPALIALIIMFYPSVAKNVGSWLWPFRNNLNGAHYFVLGLCGFALITLARNAWNELWRRAGQPPDMQNSLFVAFLPWASTTICYLYMLSRGLEEGQIPSKNWWWIGVVSGTCLTAALLVLAIFDPTPTDWVADLVNAYLR